MVEEFFPAAEKILSDIHQIFLKDPKLKSFEVVTTFQTGNKSPVLVVDQCMALESWCVPYVYCHAYNNLIKIKEEKGRIKDPDKCNILLLGALLMNPEVITFWNMRRDLVNCEKLDPYFELYFSSIILSVRPKCNEAFSYRAWIIRKIMNGSVDINLLESELDICEAAADHYSNNYHAWTHRLWCLHQTVPVVIEREWSATLQWIQRHVSDYSGLHYRQQLINALLAYVKSSSYDKELIKYVIFSVERATDSFLQSMKNLELTTESIPIALRIFIYELAHNSDLICNFIGHEALWCHRRYIFHQIKKTLYEHSMNRSWGYFETSNHSTNEGIPIEKTQKFGVHGIADQFSLMLSIYEELFLKKCSDPKEPRQARYATTHRKWVSKFSNFQWPNNNDTNNFDIKISSIVI